MNLSTRMPKRLAQPLLPLLLAFSVLVLAGCGDKGKDKASQTAVKVNKEEITVHQINFVMQQQRGLQPEQADAASKQILERLIDQELAVQKAGDLKLDRDPRVVQQLEAVRRDILARAYLEKVGDSAPKPTPEEIKKYYDEKPALFKNRRVYNLQEIAIEAKPEQVSVLREKLTAAKTIGEFIEYLKASGYRFGATQAVRAAEQLPMASLDTFAKMQDGQAVLVPSANGVQVVALAGSRDEPVSEEQARPAIEQFLLNDRKRKLMEEDVKAMRAAAKIEYLGRFAQGAASAPTGSGAASAAAATAASATAAASAAGGMTTTDISKGMGLK